MVPENQIPAVDNGKVTKSDFEMIAWGCLFVLWGIITLLEFIPIGAGIFGTGLILLALNIARRLNGIPTRSNTTLIGIIALVWGGLDLLCSLLGLPVELPLIPVLLVVLGGILITKEIQRIRKTNHPSY